ncbi:hypothetical protein KKA00_09370 [bacterium]|nr:hypothetical protein [bacterium]MBU1652419.1 hypothetical protein [bacterium]MBU1881426.1 hypothetical protein [bacterium]
MKYHTNPARNGTTPCCLQTADWPICYEDNCYMNRECQVYRGKNPAPERNYLPHPPVFILVGRFEAIPYSYRIKIADPDE